MSKSLKTLLGFALLGFVGVWMGCSSDTSPVAPQAAGKTHLTAQDPVVDLSEPDDPTTTPVAFADSNLKAAVGEALMAALNIPSVPIPITVAQMDSLTTLNARDRGIQSLTGLDYATNLDTLDLGGNQITDVSLLGYLTKLEWLSLSGNSITDLSPLTSLTKLEVLNLNFNTISDLSPLTSLTKLESLHLYANSISDVSPLANLTNLKRLTVTGNPLEGKVTPLASLTKLTWLKLNDTGIRDSGLSTLAASLTKLTFLDLSSNTISDLSPLTCLPNLERLGMRKVNDGSGPGNKYVATTSNIHIRYLIDRGVTINW